MTAADPRRNTPPLAAPLLDARGISKRFGPVEALRRVDINFRAAEIHAIVGENGAGKSTLMRIFYGLQKPDAGQVRLRGVPLRFRSALDARRAGIGMVHQELALADALNATENLALALSPPGRLRLDRARVAAAARRAANEIGLDVGDLRCPVGELPVGTRQRIEILKALSGNTRVLILDEPTTVLTPAETANLFRVLRRLRRRGTAVLFITHKLPEVLAIADRITVMRRGEVIATRRRADVDGRELAHLMVGVRAGTPARATPIAAISAAPRLRLRGIAVNDRNGRPLLRGIDLAVHPGELFGIAGVDGNGQSELFQVAVGLRRPNGGRLEVDGTPITRHEPATMIERGVGWIPPDRQRQGLILSMTVEENALLNRALLARAAAGPFLPPGAVHAAARELIRRHAIRATHLDVPATTLSGGNQQRLIAARALALNPRLLIAFNPTRGLDFTAARAVHEEIASVQKQGTAVLLISTDLDEVLTLSQRLAVFYRGRLSPTMSPPFSPARIGALMAGAGKGQRPRADHGKPSAAHPAGGTSG